jgi:hypothetical protein
MTTPIAPKLLKGGIVLIDPVTGNVKSMIALQYNPDSLTRSLQIQATQSEGGEKSEALRLKGPPIETYKLEVEIDATDQLERGDDAAVSVGIHPTLAALETILYPTSSALQANDAMANAGTLEIIPTMAPLTLFVWSKHRVVPVRFTEFSITEEAFDQNLNPVRAKVSLGMRVLSIDDLGFSHKGGGIYMVYQQQKERLAQQLTGASFSTFGIGGLP